MNHFNYIPREKRLKSIILGQGAIILVIVGLSLFLIFFGLGYKIDWANRRIIHTGILYLSYSPKNADLYIDDKKISESSPYDTNLLPGRYNVAISHQGYQSWRTQAIVEADKVLSEKNIVLFRSNPEIAVISNQDEIDSINTPYDLLVKNPQGDLTSNNYEIWVGEELITRISTPISNVIWYPGKEYIAYQQGSEIRIIDKDGTNDIKLVALSASTSAKFIFSWDGSYLLYSDSGSYKKASII